MKVCSACHSIFSSSFSHCPNDGTTLVEREPWTTGSIILEKYRILGECGSGAMASVYKAEHIKFGELRALKVITSSLASDESFVRRFTQEALLARRLQHPNAVRIDDIEKAEDGRPFIVMEFIEGIDLKHAIQQGPIDVPRIVAIARQVALALHAAHALGMIHRDIKPANILLTETPSGELAKVVDFGIAKITDEDRAHSDSSMTQTGAIIGTPAFMSPEQAMGKRGNEIDGRSDLYSLGVVMYQAITRELPIRANTGTEFLVAQVNDTPAPILKLRPEVPSHVADLIMACLEKDRDRRPANANAFIALLDPELPKQESPKQESPKIELPKSDPPQYVKADQSKAPPTKTTVPAHRPWPITPVALVAGWFLVLWSASVFSSPIVWLAVGLALAVIDAAYLAANQLWAGANRKAFVIGWSAAALLSALLSYGAGSRANEIWAYAEHQSYNVRIATIQSSIAAGCAFLCVAIGSITTLVSGAKSSAAFKAAIGVCLAFILVTTLGCAAFDRVWISIAIASAIAALIRHLAISRHSKIRGITSP